MDYGDNGDGTITMTVDVVCPQLKKDKLFSHQVTVRKADDDFLYVSNTIEQGGEVPPYTPRTAAGQ